MGNTQIIIPLALMAFFLNHASRAVGMNLSIADIFLCITVILLAISSDLYIPKFSFIFVMFLLVTVLVTSMIFTPIQFGVQPQFGSMIGGLIKIIVAFLYFIVGASVSRLNLHRVILKWYSIGAVSIAAIGIFISMLGLSVFKDVLFYSGLRFRGFMNDPNFYSTLACAGIAYFAFNSSINKIVKWGAISVLAFSVLLAGSKTGLIILAVLVLLITLTKALRSKNFIPLGILVILFLLAFPFLSSIRTYLLNLTLSNKDRFPQLERISVLLSDDPLNALSGDGSTREDSWQHGISIIKESPIFGVGIGTYTDVNKVLNSSHILAHNSYIQIAAESGIILTVVLFTSIGFLLFASVKSGSARFEDQDIDTVRVMVMVFLVGSLSLSLNNARMFWVFLGILSYLIATNSRLKSPNKQISSKST
ncbi:O-antigen ligase family protein [Corynebacterium callunae]|uniref:O-antigen ligase family protein n=1 Tax=Corynebacterium callunae TaxID=1721 RepID=UPI0039824233